MLLKNMKTLLGIKEDKILGAFEKLGIDKNIRGEMLSTSDFVNLSNELCE